MNSKEKIIITAILGVFLGVVVTLFFYVSYLSNIEHDEQDLENIYSSINRIISINDDLLSETKKLEEEHQMLSNLTLGEEDKNILKNLKSKIDLLEESGPGVIILLRTRDSNNDLSETSCLSAHLRDMRNILNLPEIKTVGVSINGHRLSYRSTINCIGNGSVVDYERITEPYKIEVIGDQTKIINMIDTKQLLPELWNDIDSNFIQMELFARDNITLIPFSGNLKSPNLKGI